MSTVGMTFDEGSHTGSERLDFAITQVWGAAIERGELRATLEPDPEPGWEIREEYWVIPSLPTARLLVPRPRVPARRSLTEFASLRDARTRAARRVLGSAVALGLPLSRHTLRIVARDGAPPTIVQAVGAEIGHPDAVAALGVYTSANAKPTLDLRTPEGEAIGFAKLAWNEVTTASLANEAAALGQLGTLSGAIEVPRLIADGLVDGRQFLITQPLPRGIASVPMTWSSLSDEEARGPGVVTDRRPIADIPQVASVLGILEGKTALTPARLADRTRDLAGRVISTGVTVPVADVFHGDFSPWNTGRDRSGRLWLFDWETAQRDAPAGLDTIHWYAHSQGGLEAQSMPTRAAAGAARSDRVLRSLGHSRTSTSVLAAWYAVTLVASEIRFAEALQGWERVKHSPAILERVLDWGQRSLNAAEPSR